MPQRGHGSPSRRVHQEAVLEAALGAVDVAEVVDRGALRVDAQLERLHHRVAERLDLRPLQRARPAQRVDPRPEERLVGVDVAHARHALLVQEEGLDGLLPPARLRAQGLGGEVGAERLHSQPRLRSTRPARRLRAARRRCRSGARRRTGGGGRRRARRPRACAAGSRRRRGAAGCRSCAGASRGRPRPRATAIRYLPRRSSRSISRPRRASAIASGGAGSHQRGSRTSTLTRRLPSSAGASWRRIVSTSGSSGMASWF